MFNESKLEIGDPTLPAETKTEVGVSTITQKGDYFYVTKVNKVIPESYKTFEECKGKIVNDYQQFLEQNWVDELKKEFKVSIDTAVFEKTKASILKQ
jgi:peptidyl-prolyl cis-trans isomerase SurA